MGLTATCFHKLMKNRAHGLLTTLICSVLSCHLDEPTQEDYVHCLQQVEQIQTDCTVLNDNELYDKRDLEKGKDTVVSLVINESSFQKDPLLWCNKDFATLKSSKFRNTDWLPLPSQPKYSPPPSSSSRFAGFPPNPLESWILFPRQEDYLIFSHQCHCDAGQVELGIQINSAYRIVVLDRQAGTCRVELLNSPGAT